MLSRSLLLASITASAAGARQTACWRIVFQLRARSEFLVEYTVFLSHSAADASLVYEVKRRSEAVGIRVYTYEDDAQASRSIASKLTNAIRASDGVVAVLTKNAAARPAIQQEIGAAVALGKPIYALVEDGVEVAALTLLQGLEYIRLDFERIGDAMCDLQRSIAARREQVRKGLISAMLLLLAIVAVIYAASHDQ